MRAVPLFAVVAVAALLPTVAATEHPRFTSRNLAEGDTFEVTFDHQGEHLHHCTPHPFMAGFVRVDPAANATGRVEIEIMDLEFVPDSVVVPPGTTVVWTNRDSATTSGPRGHTVTEDIESPGPDEPGRTAEGGGDAPTSAVGLLTAVGAFAAALVLRRRPG